MFDAASTLHGSISVLVCLLSHLTKLRFGAKSTLFASDPFSSQIAYSHEYANLRRKSPDAKIIEFCRQSEFRELAPLKSARSESN